MRSSIQNSPKRDAFSLNIRSGSTSKQNAKIQNSSVPTLNEARTHAATPKRYQEPVLDRKSDSQRNSKWIEVHFLEANDINDVINTLL